MQRIALLALALVTSVPLASARDVYVSKDTGSNDGDGSKEKPIKLLWKAMSSLQPGDVVHVAEGVYNGQGKKGVMPKITAGQVTLEGGWAKDWSARDPFKHLTIITGAPDVQGDTREVFQIDDSMNKVTDVTIDGFCIDRGTALYYYSDNEGGSMPRIEGHSDNCCWGYRGINKKKSGSDPCIELLGKGSFTVRNNILINNPWWGISVKAGGSGEVVIENNLILGYQGRGIEAIAGSGWGQPKFIIRNNTVACGSTIEGRALSLDPRKAQSGSYLVENNVLFNGAQAGLMTKFGAETLTLKNNLFYLFAGADVGDGGSPKCNAKDFEDELTCPNSGNVHELPKFMAKLEQAWVDRWSQWGNMTSNFAKGEEIDAVRKSAGLGDYSMPFFAGKTYAGYDQLPKGRIDFTMSRYPKPYKKGEALMDWQKSIIPAIGADGARGIQPFKK
ncbi:MAG: right-handed parallel beta-helix repeat-containing protein [Planctomycetota bacterium]